MPHKHNPITSEKVCGMARLCRGYFMALAETVALWEDRDLTNSSVERIACVDLASTVEHMLDSMIGVMSHLEVDRVQMANNMALHPEVWSATMQTLAQKHFRLGPIEASTWVRGILVGLSGHMNSYPGNDYFLGFIRSKVYAWATEVEQEWEPWFEEFKSLVNQD